MTELDALYIAIMDAGLTKLRDAAVAGDLDQCKAEAEHLHNLPSLIGEENRQRHLYYFSTERTAYLKWVLSCNRRHVKEFVWTYYLPRWAQIGKILGFPDAV
jgi:hypothetical protein